MELVILAGLQASGKSTFRRSRFDSSHVVVSKDNFQNNRRPGRRQEQLIRAAFREGRSVVVDNTNPRVEDRTALVRLGREYGATVSGYVVRSTVELSLARNAAREGRARVPEVGIVSTARVFVPPSWSEGFDELYEVTTASDMSFVVRRIPKEA